MVSLGSSFSARMVLPKFSDCCVPECVDVSIRTWKFLFDCGGAESYPETGEVGMLTSGTTVQLVECGERVRTGAHNHIHCHCTEIKSSIDRLVDARMTCLNRLSPFAYPGCWE